VRHSAGPNKSMACITLSVTPLVWSGRGPKLIVMSRGTDLDRASLRFAFSSEWCLLTSIFDQSTGVPMATSAQYRHTNINVETSNESSSPICRTPITNIEDRISLGRRRTGDCRRTACSRCDSSCSRWLISEAILVSKVSNASRKCGIEEFDSGAFVPHEWPRWTWAL
jgi:hypothetical protein